jgi:hypothetical protein
MQLLLRTIVAGSVLTGLLSSSPLAAQPVDRFLGTWKLNVAQSKFSPGPGPKSVTVTFGKEGAGFRLTVKGVAADGSAIDQSYTATYDGMDSPVTGSADYDAISVKLIDASTRHTVRKKGGKQVQVVHSVASKDGKHYTSTTKGVNAKGEKVESVAVYDKQ